MSSKKSHDGDERFSRVQKDPRFWEMPEKERKIKIDKRFQSMFHDKRFKVTYTVDKRGRPVNHTSTEDLKRFYKLSDSEEEEVKKKDDDDDGDDDDEEEQVDDEEQLEEEEEEKEEASDVSEEDSDSGEEDSDSGPDLARGKGNVETSSDEDEEDDVDAVLRREEEEIQHDWGELCKDAPRRDEVSSRLAVCNMDWDRLKAKDLLALVNSFTPAGGAVLSVKIYPSEFGKERLKLEESQGPMELRSLPEDEEDDTEEERVYREKLRDYQFKRLKYFYAVVECDSATTAQKIYEECDGYEYESSCSVLDLRFIPDDMTFEEQPKDKATDVNLPTYTPKLFSSSATSTSKVQLTWDETDHDRVTALNRKFTNDELLEMDFNAYLASSSEEDEEEEGVGGEEVVEDEPVTEEEEEEQKEKKRKKKRNEEHISKYRELLRGIQDKERRQQEDKDMEMEITWVPGLKETTEQLVKKKLEGKDKLTPWEDFLQKKREKKKMKKTERKQGLADVSDDDLPADVDLSDPYFAEELGSTGGDGAADGGRRRRVQTQTLQLRQAGAAAEPEQEEEAAAAEEGRRSAGRRPVSAGRQRPPLPGHVHQPPLQPGPLPPQLQEDQSHAEHPGGETAPQRGGGAETASNAHSRGHAHSGLSDDAAAADGAESVAAGQIGQKENGAVSGSEEEAEAAVDAGLQTLDWTTGSAPIAGRFCSF
ncbi:ESF1 homolog isoform 2-T2 [Pholidichthys leucotaenia]